MKSVSLNSTNKTRWWKISVHYDKPSECNDMALATAARLRDKYPGVYFARYCSALESRADFYVQCFTNVTPVRQSLQIEKVILTFSLAHLNRTAIPKIDKPLSHQGSEAHAAGFDCVLKLAKAFALHVDDSDVSEAVPEPDKLKAATADVMHWMHNMIGIDYVDEARQSIYAIERILTIFEACINAPTKELKKN